MNNFFATLECRGMAAFTLKVHILYDMPLASYTPPSSSTTQWVGGVDIHFSNIMCYFPILLPYQILNLEYSFIEKVKEKIHLGDLFKWINTVHCNTKSYHPLAQRCF